jgi:hypothetical protein
VHNQVNTHLTEITGVDFNYKQTNLQIVDLNAGGNSAQRMNSGGLSFLSSGLTELDGAWRIKLNGDLAVIGTNKCRAFGSFYTYTFNTINEDCAISLVNISNPNSPRFGDLEDSISLSKAHVLDMDVYENYIITAELVFLGLSTAGKGATYTASGGHKLTLNLYEIRKNVSTSGARVINLVASSDVINLTSTSIGSNNYGSQTILNKVASVKTDGEMIYLSYIDKVYVYRLDKFYWGPGKFVGTPSIPLVSTLTYTTRTGGVKAFDARVAGDYLYLLNGGSASGVNDQQYRSDTVYLTKINTSNKTACYVEWEETVTNGGTRLEVVGGKAYIASQTFPNGSNYKHGIVTFDLDSIKTGHATISNLRSDNSKIVMDLEVGNNAKVYNSMSIGETLKVGRDLYSNTGNFRPQPRVKTGSSRANSTILIIDSSLAGVYTWTASFSSTDRTARISRLVEGSSFFLYIRNEGPDATTVTIEASSSASGFLTVNLSRGGGQTSVSSVTLDPNGGAATVWLANVNGIIIGAVY